jgi:hypothetical protein
LGLGKFVDTFEKENESFIINTPNPSYQESPDDDDYDIDFEPNVFKLS